MKIYISGPITGIPDYKKKFQSAKKYLKDLGFIVLDPTLIKASLEYENYMTIDFAMISVCDAIYMLKGWKKSLGAIREYHFALSKGIEIIEEGAESWRN